MRIHWFAGTSSACDVSLWPKPRWAVLLATPQMLQKRGAVERPDPDCGFPQLQLIYFFLKSGSLGDFLSGRTRAACVEIRLDSWELAKTEACLLNQVQYRTIGAIHQNEVVAQKPFVVDQTFFQDFDYTRQHLFATCDSILIPWNPKDPSRDSVEPHSGR